MSKRISDRYRQQEGFRHRSWSFFFKNIDKLKLPERERRQKYVSLKHFDVDENDLNEEDFVNQLYDEEQLKRWNVGRKHQEEIVRRGCALRFGSEGRNARSDLQKLEENVGFAKLAEWDTSEWVQMR